MVLGCYYLTRPKESVQGEGKIFGSIEEVLLAYENKAVDLHANVHLKHNDTWNKNTTVGRVIFNSILPDEIGFINEIINKKRLTKAVNEAYMIAGNAKTVIFLDKLKDLGFAMATKSGVSIAICDILIPNQ